VLDIVDMVLIMSVNPGFGGQSLIPYCLDKIRELRALKPELNIQIDGGVKLDNILACKEAGANIFVVGSAIFGKPDPEAVCREFVAKVNG
jgi:ribulose-phosphate 3-epimerase